MATRFSYFFRVLLATAGLVLLVCGPASAQTAPGYHTVIDVAGRPVTLKTNIRRIVLLWGRDIYELSALLGDETPQKLIGWGDSRASEKDAYITFTQRYPQLKNVVLPADGGRLDPEYLVPLKPDIVIANNYQTFIMTHGSGIIDRYAKLGLPLFFVDMFSDPLTTPQESVLALGRALGKQQRAEQIVDFANNRIARIEHRLVRITGPEPSIYLEAGSTGAGVIGPSYSGKYVFGAILARCRCRSITDHSVAAFAPASMEYVVKANPDIIVITGLNWRPVDGMQLGYCATQDEALRLLAGYARRTGWSGLKAYKSRRFFGLFHGFAFHIYGFAGLESLAKILYPDEFRDIDPVADLAAFHARFMPVKLTGVWIVRLP